MDSIPKKIALFHPWIKSKGGAERVILELLKKSRHNIDIYTWAYDRENTFPEFGDYKINVILPKIGKKLSRYYIIRGLFLPLSLFKKIPLYKYDKFLISTSGVAEFLTFRNYKKGNTYAYVHTPLREATEKIVKWNLSNREDMNLLKKSVYLLAVKIYRIFEKLAWKRLDIIIFNSELSKSRAEERGLIINKESHIVYPPINFSEFGNGKDKKYFIYVSRLNPPKRQDVLIEAWKIFSKNNKNYKLIIVGAPENKRYHQKLLDSSKSIKSIKIKTHVSQKELNRLYGNCTAGLFLGYQEDFGIVPLEILSSGKPLIAVDEGGYIKLIKNHPHFHPIKEKHNQKEMINEIANGLKSFLNKKFPKKVEKIKIRDFVTEIDRILE
ncbi:MAG: glycosyltransferase [Candidatus Pacearchaeota archaeon]|nr:glycosyltransferase [Candidatus Pacearchaeota archaeon]